MIRRLPLWLDPTLTSASPHMQRLSVHSSLAELMVEAGVERTAQKRLDLIPELHRVLGPHAHLIGFRIAPCLDDLK
jgi:hypothetical protein